MCDWRSGAPRNGWLRLNAKFRVVLFAMTSLLTHRSSPCAPRVHTCSCYHAALGCAGTFRVWQHGWRCQHGLVRCHRPPRLHGASECLRGVPCACVHVCTPCTSSRSIERPFHRGVRHNGVDCIRGADVVQHRFRPLRRVHASPTCQSHEACCASYVSRAEWARLLGRRFIRG